MTTLFRSAFFMISLLFLSNVSLAETFWIDVRSTEEHAQDSIKGDILIPHTDIANKIATVTENKNAEIHLYCRSGRRAELAKATLTSLGYTHVINDGGIDDARKKHPATTSNDTSKK
jgi:phage shock protein E